MDTLEFLARQILGAIEEGNSDVDQAVHDLRAYLDDQDTARADHEFTIEAARSNYADDDCGIPDKPLLSVAEDAVWVQAWVRVPLEEPPGGFFASGYLWHPASSPVSLTTQGESNGCTHPHRH